jgi:hypothetical protein
VSRAVRRSPDDDAAIRVARLRAELRNQQRRYGIAESPPHLARLETAVDRRTARISHVRSQIVELEAELHRLLTEVSGYAKGLEALLGDELERIRNAYGEGWSPVPILGYRVWSILDGRLHGARMVWTTPHMRAVCVTAGGPSDEIPHNDGRCGRLGCGVYAAKRIRPLLDEVLPARSVRFVAGLVELGGKVVEHERGYRAATAEVVAVAAVADDRLLTTDDPAVITRLFADPGPVLASMAATGAISRERLRISAADWLEARERARDPWAALGDTA